MRDTRRELRTSSRVFTGFTISQAGMVQHHRTEREPGWRRGLVINSVGAVATAIVLCTVVVSKFTTGAWIPVVVIPAIMAVFRVVKRHYTTLKLALRVPPDYHAEVDRDPLVVVLVSRLHRGAVDAIAYARTITDGEVRVATVVGSDEEEAKLRGQWDQVGLDLPFAAAAYDRQSVAHAVGAELGIDTVMAEVLPEGKVEAVRRLKATHGQIARDPQGGGGTGLHRCSLSREYGTATCRQPRTTCGSSSVLFNVCRSGLRSGASGPTAAATTSRC